MHVGAKLELHATMEASVHPRREVPGLHQKPSGEMAIGGTTCDMHGAQFCCCVPCVECMCGCG